MATETVNPTTATLETLSQKVAQAIGIADLIRYAPAGQLAPDTLENAGGALDDILRDIDLGIGAMLTASQRDRPQ